MLEKLHNRTQKQHAELQRTKFKRGITDADPEMAENFKLLNDVNVKIESVKREKQRLGEELAKFTKRRTAEADSSGDTAAASLRGFCSTDFIQNPEMQDEPEEEIKFQYLDPGNHWCEKCATFHITLEDYLVHLHSDDHWKVR